MSDLPVFHNMIDGETRPAESGALMDSVNPSTGEVWAQFPVSDRADADAAVAAAARAFPEWSRLSSNVRADYLRKAYARLVEHGEELARLESTDNGNPFSVMRRSSSDNPNSTWTRASYQAAEAVTGKMVTLDATMQGFTRREPWGVVAVIIPFNMPLGMFGMKVSAALVAGNTVVVKPPEQAASGILRAGELLADVFPRGVLNVISGEAEAGDALVRHPDVAKITMTGSTATARLIQAAAADTLTPSVFELGGKSPGIVFDDADLDVAARGVTLPSLYNFNAGQACVATSRILIHRSILDEMLKRMQTIAESVVTGDPFDPATTMGPIISREQYDRVLSFIEIGGQEAELVFGGRHGADVVPGLPGGYWVEPTLFLGKDNSLRMCREEIFGPVGVVIPFDTDDEAIAIANDTRYGLAAGVWTRDLARVDRCIRDLQAGSVWVNTYMQQRHELPFGGFGDSGYSHDSVLEFTREKAAVIAV